MNLKDTLCQIKTNRFNIAHGWLPLLVIFDDHHPGTSMPSGGHPPHQLAARLRRGRPFSRRITCHSINPHHVVVTDGNCVTVVPMTSLQEVLPADAVSNVEFS
jgi:hypothetical protein